MTDKEFDAFAALWASTEAFHKRFDQYPPKLAPQMGCVYEEVDEVESASRQAAWITRHTGDPSAARRDVAEEVADVIVTLMGVCMAVDVTRDDLLAAMDIVARKNDAKSWDGYYVDKMTGKITRKKK